MKKLFPLFLIALFMCWSLAFADRTPTSSSTDVSYMPGENTSSLSNPGTGESNLDGESIYNNVDPGNTADVAPYRLDSGNLPVITAYRDSVLAFDPQTPTGDARILGIEFANGFFWLTGAGDGTGADSVHKFDPAGNHVGTYPQSTTSAWGWRDLAWDGTYLYGSDSPTLIQLDISSGAPIPTGVTIPGPENPNRALAYDPATDHFWTANFSGPIYEFDRAGNIINTYANTKSVYGMAWDALTPGGPWLWVHSQDGTPGMEISKFDPVNGVYTSESWQSDLIDGNTTGIAGGACFTNEWSAPLPTIFVVGQGSPVDFVYGYDMTPDTVTGACCDDATGSCTDGVLESQCPSPNRWAASTLCADLQPPCGTTTGACCVAEQCVATNTQAECDVLQGDWYEGEDCATFQCPLAIMSCPPNSLFDQIPHDPDDAWSAATSDAAFTENYAVFENFAVSGEICDIHWWGFSLEWNAGWFDCAGEAMAFDIIFYPDIGGLPDTSNPACVYTNVTPTMTNTGLLYAGFASLWRFDLILNPCCNLTSGWVMIQGVSVGSPDCRFLWLSSPFGDGDSYQRNAGVMGLTGFDRALCLTGQYVPEYGACCDDFDGTCTDNVEIINCPPPLRFQANTLCADLQPPCGILGACCVNDQCVATNTQAECDALQGDWYEGEDCSNFTCPHDPTDCNDPDVVYSNGEQVTFVSNYNVAQCDIAYPFQFATADDFELAGTDLMP
jgi:hypothetical protein